MPGSPAEPFVMTPYLECLLARQDLTPADARAVLEAIMAGRVAPPALAAFLTALRAKGESEEELAACAAVMRERAVPIQAPPDALDTCGTGGDHSQTFNISTAAALVAAALGIPVAKHGNRSASSRSGSAEVLQKLGVNIEAPPAVVERCIRAAGLGFLFAPLLHPGMKHAGPVRRELGIRTIFNLLGPLANPARARRQLLGVFEPRWCEPFARVLRRLGSESAFVVCGTGPGGRGWLDEVSTWGPTTIAVLREGEVRIEPFDAREVGFEPPASGALTVGGVEASAALVWAVLDGRPGPAREIVLVNAAAAALVAGQARDWREGVARAAEALDSGGARTVLAKLIECSQRA